MAATTDFNVAPYWDSFNIDNDFYRVLFRPGFAVQARELTTLQTILQNQIEQFGNHFFKEGTIVIPGSVAYDDTYYAVKLQSTYGSGTVSTYLEQFTAGTWNSVLYEEGAIITGSTSGITAQVIGYAVATTAGDPDTLFVKYTGTNTTDNTTSTFTDDETLFADRPISSYVVDAASVQCLATSASATGTAASVTEGIFFVRGFMCRTSGQTIVLDKYTNTPSYRIGFTVNEQLITPEEDTSLLDNAQGSSNYAAKGAHRFKITLTLSKKELTATDDTGFIELARVDNGNVVHRKKATEYSIVADMIARRTADESGDYVVKHFDIEPRENLSDGTNRGIYTAAQGGLETLDTLVISPGKAYVNGYEIDKMSASFVNIDKARTTKAVNNDNVPFNLGNYAKVDNVYSQPDVSLVTTALDPFKKVSIYDKQTTSTRGNASGTRIGEARSRSFGYGSGGAVGAGNAIYHHYLFDVSMYTKIALTANATTLTATAVITGATSGATGILVTTVSGGATLYLMQVEGSFQDGEAITSSIGTDVPGIGLIQDGVGVVTYDFGASAKQIFGDNTTIDYTADVILDQSLTLTGEVSTAAGGATAVTGTNTRFLTELNVLDVIELPSGAAGITEKFRVGAIASNTAMTIELTGTGTANATSKLTSAKAIRIRAKIAEEEETVLVYKMPKSNVESLLTLGVTDTTYSFRKQFIGTTSSGAVSFSAGTGEDFDSTNTAANYTLTITVPDGSASGLVGDIIDLSSTKAASTTIGGTGTQTLTVTDTTIMGNNCEVVLTASITTPGKTQKSKTAQKMTKKTIAATLPNVFGERVDDATINLSYSDVYKLHAVYEAVDISTAPVAPTLTISGSTGTFTVGEIITGSSSAATGRVIINSPSTTVEYVVLAGIFTTNDNITGGTSTYTATVTAVTSGDRNITANWLLDTGQRDSFYDLGRGSRRPDAVTPTGQLLFVYDYFSHGAGDYFSVDSYTGQIDYENIPAYSASKVDPESKAPIGFYELRDSLDFRPSVQNQTAPATNPFAFNNKNFEGTGSAGNLVIPDANVRSDFTFYLGRLDLLYLDSQGNFLIRKGIPAEDPRWAQTDNNNMLIAKLSIAPYTFDASREIIIGFQYVRRYTMRDIGKLHTRVGNLEYATALGLLERQTDSFQVLDDNGLDRFKSGFVVDTFYGHNLGLITANDYSCGMDPAKGHMRPQASQYMTKLIEENTTDSQRTSSGYQKTGDVITLPYTHVADTIQPYASRIQSVNPFNVTLWVGQLTLAPDTDIWIDTERAPSITMNVEGNYEQLLREQGGQTTTGMIWDDWNTTWTGNRRTSAGSRTVEVNAQGSGAGGDLIRWVTRSGTTTFDRRQVRTGSNTRLVERIDTQSTGDRVVNIEIVPWIRPGQVNFTVTGMKPNTRVYAFFDRVDVNAECKPILTSANSTTLNGALTKTATTVTVASTTGFPTTGTIGVGALDRVDWQGVSFKAMEQMTYTGTTATSFTGVTRNTGNAFVEPQEWVTATVVSNETYGTELVSDSAGNLYGRFEIPNTETKRFRIGTRTFRLTDSSTNSLVPGSVETAVEGTYTASGMIQTKQEVIFNVRNATRTVQTATQTRADTVTTGGGRINNGNWYDPLAQTLMCDSENGMFVTKVDVFFQAKDDVLPVWVELRTVRDGYPSQEIFPFSKIVKTPAEVNLDATGAATATTFTFDSPIYVQNNQEYCVVLASNSAKYKVWICRLGDTEIGGTRTISSQPTLGSLFKSQNASTWEPSQYEDLKFTIYKAQYDTAAAGSFVMVNEELTTKDPNELTAIAQPIRLGGGKTAGIPTLPNNPIDTSSGVTSLTLTGGGTGYTSAPAVTFTGGSGTGAAAVATISGGVITALTITNPGSGYITTPTISFVGGGGSSATATATISSTSVRVRFRDHGMYDVDNNVVVTGAISDIGGSALNGAIGSGTTGTVNVDSSLLWPTTGYVRIDDEIIYYGSKPGATSISITTRGVGTTIAASHEDNSLVSLYMLGGIPLTEINKTHTSISGIETDSFIVTTTTAATATVSGGGEGVQCSRNIHMDVMQPLIQIMELPSTEITGKVQTTTSSSPNGGQNSFTRTTASDAYDVPLNEDYYFEAPQMIASKVNETAEIAGNKSFRLTTTLTSTDVNVSPQIDTSRMGIIGIGNRLNEIDTSANVGALTPYHSMTASSGDNNNTIYITKKITLSQSATALQVLLDGVKMTEGDIIVLYKTLRTDSAENFDDIEWSFFNTTGVPDSTVTISKTRSDFKEYRYFAGKNSLGVGTELNEFVAFAVKIVLQGSNTSLPPLVKDFRAIAFQA